MNMDTTDRNFKTPLIFILHPSVNAYEILMILCNFVTDSCFIQFEELVL